MRGAELIKLLIQIRRAKSEGALWRIERRLATNGNADDSTRYVLQKLQERRHALRTARGEWARAASVMAERRCYLVLDGCAPCAPEHGWVQAGHP